MKSLDLKSFTDDEIIEIDSVEFTLTTEIPAKALLEIENLRETGNMDSMMKTVRYFLVKSDPARIDTLLEGISVRGMTTLLRFLSEWLTEKMKADTDKKKD